MSGSPAARDSSDACLVHHNAFCSSPASWLIQPVYSAMRAASLSNVVLMGPMFSRARPCTVCCKAFSGSRSTIGLVRMPSPRKCSNDVRNPATTCSSGTGRGPLPASTPTPSIVPATSTWRRPSAGGAHSAASISLPPTSRTPSQSLATVGVGGLTSFSILLR